MVFLLTLLLGAAWRRWFGSGRPDWAFTGYRAMQVAGGWAVLFFLCVIRNPGLIIADALVAIAAIGWMTLPIAVSRQPFVWLLDRSPWLPTFPYLKGSAEWGEFLQGACLFAAAALVASIL